MYKFTNYKFKYMCGTPVCMVVTLLSLWMLTGFQLEGFSLKVDLLHLGVFFQLIPFNKVHADLHSRFPLTHIPQWRCHRRTPGGRSVHPSAMRKDTLTTLHVNLMIDSPAFGG